MTDYIDVLRRVEPLRRDRNRIVERLEQLRSAAEGLTRTVRDALDEPPVNADSAVCQYRIGDDELMRFDDEEVVGS